MSGSQAVTSSGDELAVVWDMHQGSCLNVLEGHSGEVRSVVLTRRGRCAPETCGPCRSLALSMLLSTLSCKQQQLGGLFLVPVLCAEAR